MPIRSTAPAMFKADISISFGWQHVRLYEFWGPTAPGAPLLLLLVYVALMPCHWVSLKKTRVAAGMQRGLFFLTGPCVFFCLSLTVHLGAELIRVAEVGGITKVLAV